MFETKTHLEIVPEPISFAYMCIYFLRQVIASSHDVKRGLWLGARVKLTPKQLSDKVGATEVSGLLEQFNFAWCLVRLEGSNERIKCRIGQLKLCEQVLGMAYLQGVEIGLQHISWFIVGRMNH